MWLRPVTARATAGSIPGRPLYTIHENDGFAPQFHLAMVSNELPPEDVDDADDVDDVD